MDLERKIEEIRRQPEHIKNRYVYVSVAISMFFILLLWFFSLTDTIGKTNLDLGKNNAAEDFQSQKKSLEDATSEAKKALSNLGTNLEKPASEK